MSLTATGLLPNLPPGKFYQMVPWQHRSPFLTNDRQTPWLCVPRPDWINARAPRGLVSGKQRCGKGARRALQMQATNKPALRAKL